MVKKNSLKTKLSKVLVLALALVMCLGVAGISAYFTDGDEATNSFTVGSVEIELHEDAWDALPDADDDGIPDVAEIITPEKEIAKDPVIENTGNNDAYVFLEIVVPYADSIVTANEAGEKQAAAEHELFSYDINYAGANTAKWVEVTGEINGVTYPIKDETAKTYTHLYAYGTATEMTALAADASTEALFNYIEFVNVVEEQGLEGTDPEIVVKAYAIQTLNINDGADDTFTGANADGKVAPKDVWSVLDAQREVN